MEVPRALPVGLHIAPLDGSRAGHTDSGVTKQTGATLEHLAREFHLDQKDLKGLV